MTKLRAAIRELTVLKYMNEVTSETVEAWTKRIKSQWPQKVMLESLKDIKEFDMIRET